MTALNTGYQMKLMSSLEKVFADVAPVEDISALDFTVLQNETLSFQAAVYGPGNGIEAVTVHVVSSISQHVRIRSVELVPAAYPCHPDRDENYLRTIPGMYPDLLRDLKDGAFYLVAGQWRSLWLDVENAPAGRWNIEIELRNEQGERLCGASAQVEVFSATLPKQTLRHTQWFHGDCIADYYNVEVFSEFHWSAMEHFIHTAVRRGINMFLTPCFTPPLDTAVGGERTTIQLVDVFVENGEYRFCFDKLRRWVEMVRRCGGEYFEIAHLFTQWGASFAPKVMATVNGVYKRIFGWDTPAVGGAYTRFLKAFLPELTGLLRAWGVAGCTYFHISDEPSEKHLENYLAAKRSVEKELEGFTLIDALSSYEFYQHGAVEKPICANDHIEAFLEHQVPGLWTYYCTAQGCLVSNRFMAMPSARNRILGIQMYKFGIEGFLQWGYNFYNTMYSLKHINPYAVTDCGGAFPSGDPFLVYPGEGGVPEESIRMMVFAEALQDLRALQSLEQSIGREAVIAMLEEGLSSPITFSCYPKNPQYLLSLRNRVNRLIMGQAK